MQRGPLLIITEGNNDCMRLLQEGEQNEQGECIEKGCKKMEIVVRDNTVPASGLIN